MSKTKTRSRQEWTRAYTRIAKAAKTFSTRHSLSSTGKMSRRIRKKIKTMTLKSLRKRKLKRLKTGYIQSTRGAREKVRLWRNRS